MVQQPFCQKNMEVNLRKITANSNSESITEKLQI